MSLDEKTVAVITGAGSGIGRALSLRLAKEKISGIAISDVNAEGLAETAEMLKPSGVRATTHRVNVASLEEMQEFRDEVLRQHGRVTHLINNAGVSLFGNVEEVSIDDFRWLMDINFWGTVYGVKLFLPILREQPSAHIINVSSVFGFVAPPGNAAYSASKFAVRGFTESLRHELAGSSIAVSCVHPGGIATNIARSGRLGEKAKEKDKEMSVRFHTRASRTTADEAAETIVRGIKRRSGRILIGSDAYMMDRVQRLVPVRYFGLLDRLAGGNLSRLQREKSNADSK